jgi:hypothetical protein
MASTSLLLLRNILGRALILVLSEVRTNCNLTTSAAHVYSLRLTMAVCDIISPLPLCNQVLLDYERFELIRVLLKNRAKILYCTKLKQAKTDEARLAVEEEMMADPSGAGPAILQQLSQVATAESWVSDRMADFRSKSLKEAQQLKSMHADADAAAAGEGVIFIICVKEL